MRADGLAARLGWAGRTITTPQWTLDPRRTRRWRDFTIWVVNAGRGTFYADSAGSGPMELQPGDCLLLPGGVDYTVIRNPATGLDHFYVHFDYLDPDGQPIPPRDLNDPPPIHRRFDDYPFARGLILRTIGYIGVPGGHGEADLWLRALLGEIARQDDQPKLAGPEQERAQAIQRICLQVRDHPARRITVAEMAAKLGYTPSHFCRVFRDHVGCSPQRFILDTRMAAARHLLHDSGHSIGHIADLLGYRDAYFFTRQFREHHGMSPSQFRRSGSTPVESGESGGGSTS